MFPLSIYYEYNISNFTDFKDPIKKLAHNINELFNDDIKLCQDGSRVHIKEVYIKNGYPATAYYYFRENVEPYVGRYEDGEYIRCDEHPEKLTTKLKIRIAKESLEFMREAFKMDMKRKSRIKKLAKRMIQEIFPHSVDFKYTGHVKHHDIGIKHTEHMTYHEIEINVQKLPIETPETVHPIEAHK